MTADKSVQVQIKQYLSIEETAQLLGTSLRTIQRLIAKGDLKSLE